MEGGSGSCNLRDACETTLARNPGARFQNACGTSYFEQGRERVTYSATAQWKPVSQLTLTADWLRVDADYDNFNQSLYAFPGNTWNSANKLTGLNVEDGIVTSASFTNALSVFDAQYRIASMHSQTWPGKAEWDDDHWGLNVEAGKNGRAHV